MISKEEVIHIAKLARLELTDQEIPKMQKDLSAILDYFAVLKKAPKVAILKKRAASAKASASQARKDKIEQRPASLANNLIAQAPNKQDGYIKVKAIL